MSIIAAGTTIINIQEGSYWISYGKPEFDTVRVGGGNGLLVVVPGVILVLPGTFWGPLRLTFETHDSLPPLVVDGWDEVVEVSAFASKGMAAIQELSGDTPDPTSLRGATGDLVSCSLPRPGARQGQRPPGRR